MDDICKLGQAANQRRRQGWISLTVANMTGGVPKRRGKSKRRRAN